MTWAKKDDFITYEIKLKVESSENYWVALGFNNEKQMVCMHNVLYELNL